MSRKIFEEADGEDRHGRCTEEAGQADTRRSSNGYRTSSEGHPYCRRENERVADTVVDVGDRVARIDDRVAGVEDKVKAVENRVAGVDERVRTVGDNVAVVIKGAQIISSQSTEMLFNPYQPDGHETRIVMQQAANDVDQVNRLSFSNRIDISCVGSTIRAGNQLWQHLRTWLSPPDPYTNHNIACNVHHEGTATWLFQESTFRDWKSTSSLLWLYGKRTFLYRFPSGAI